MRDDGSTERKLAPWPLAAMVLGLAASHRGKLSNRFNKSARRANHQKPVQSPPKKYFTSRLTQITSITPDVLFHRGALRTSRNAGRDAVDAAASGAQ
jgi:hypothetical protein